MKNKNCATVAVSKCGLKSYEDRFVEIFRSTPTNTVCPNFFVLHHAHGCLFSPVCSYCYLKSSFDRENPRDAFVNTEKLLAEVRTWINTEDLESYTLNTGNLSDSLAFEKARPLMGEVVELFRTESEAKNRPHSLLLLTKGGIEECQTLLSRQPCSRVLVSFSVNNAEAARRLESGAAPVEGRMEAARMLKKQGWRIRMRLDPMISGYDYSGILSELRDLAPERVTLGTLRAEASLLPHVNGLFKELEPPAFPKGLSRYPWDQRIAMYRPAVAALKAVSSIGLCEETPDSWDALGLPKAKCPCNCGSDRPEAKPGN